MIEVLKSLTERFRYDSRLRRVTDIAELCNDPANRLFAAALAICEQLSRIATALEAHNGKLHTNA